MSKAGYVLGRFTAMPDTVRLDGAPETGGSKETLHEKLSTTPEQATLQISRTGYCDRTPTITADSHDCEVEPTAG